MVEPDEAASSDRPRFALVVLMLGVVLVGLNLRLSLSVVAPLIPQLRHDLGIDAAAAGGLASSAVVLFGVLALLAPRIARRIGLRWSVGVALLLVAAGSAVRVSESLWLLYVGMVLIGAGIGLMNVVLPALVRVAFPARMALGTALYTSALNVGSAVAAAGAVPLAAVGGWGFALLAAGAPAVLAAALWSVTPLPKRNGPGIPTQLRVLLPNATAWHVAAYMSIQSMLYYVLLVWLPTIFVDAGMDRAAAGSYLSLAQVMQLAACLLVPTLARRSGSTVALGVASAVPIAIAYGGIAFAPVVLAPVWVVLLGLGQGAALTIALVFIAERGATASVSLALSGFSQCIGYFAAAAAPVVVGFVHDVSGSWAVAISPLLLLCVALGAIAWRLRDGQLVAPRGAGSIRATPS